MVHLCSSQFFLFIKKLKYYYLFYFLLLLHFSLNRMLGRTIQRHQSVKLSFPRLFLCFFCILSIGLRFTFWEQWQGYVRLALWAKSAMQLMRHSDPKH